MSSDYRLNLIWTAHGEQLRADIERNIGALTGFDNQVTRHTRNLGLWGQQMRAVGTTIRYALAGATVYGVAGAVQGLGQFLDRLGQIDSLAGEIDDKGRFQSLGRQLNDVGNMAVELSDKWGIAVDDIEQHMIRFYSSFGDQVRGQRGLSLLRAYSSEMERLTMIAEGADPQALGGGIAGLVISQTGPGRRPNPAQFGRMTDIIARVLQETPTITGADIARDVGRLSAAVTAARMTPEEIFAAYGLAARSGGSGAVIGRGITQLFTSELIRPQTKAQMQAFRRAGLPTDPTALREMGGFEILKRMMESVTTGRVSVQNPMALSDESLDDPTAIAGAGVRGINLTLASQFFGRQESFRQFLNLIANGGVPALEQFIDGIRKAERERLGAQMADARNRQRAYQQFTQTMHNVGLTVARGFDPIMRPLAQLGSRLGGAINDANPAIASGAVAGAGASAVAARLIFGTSIVGALGKGVGRIPGVGPLLNRMGLGRLIGRAPALSAAALVGSGLNAFEASGLQGAFQGAGSRNNPFWVVIDPLSWFMPGAPGSGMGGGSGGGGGGGLPPVAGFWARNWKSMLRGGTVATAVLATPFVAKTAQDALTRHEIDQGGAREVPGGHPLLAALARPRRATGISFMQQPSDAQQRILSSFVHRYISADVAEKRLRALEMNHGRVTQRGGTGFGFAEQLVGEAGITIQFKGTPELEAFLRDINRREHVPVKLWPKTSQRQTFRGQQKTQRGAGGGR